MKTVIPKLRFPEFREEGDWEVKLLGEKTIKIGSGITPKGGDKIYTKVGRPFVRSQNVGWGYLILDDISYIDEKTHSTFSSTEIMYSDVLLNITGASIGRSALADLRIIGGNVNQHVCIIRTKKELFPLFLNQYLLSNYGQNQIDSFQAGGNRQGLNFAQIRSLSIPFPPSLPEQQKIAATLSSLDDLITAQSEKIKALQAHKKSLMQQLFPAEGERVPRLRFPEFWGAGDWEVKKLGDICSNITSGKDKSSSSGKYDLYGSTGKIGKTEKKSLSGKFILVARVGANAGQLTIVNGKFGVTDNTLILYLNDSLIIDFIYFLLNKIGLNFIKFGSGQPLITAGQLKSFEIFLPSKDEQQKIAATLLSVDELIVFEGEKLKVLQSHKIGMTQQLFPNPNI